jgi:hypothetical protein
MGLKPFRDTPSNPIEWARYLQSVDVTPSVGTITDETFANRAANSVIGRPTNTQGAPSDILADADGHFLTRRAGVVVFDGITDADLPSGIARDTEVAGAITTAIDAHVAAVDPHTQYQTQTESDARYRQQSVAITFAELTGVPTALSFIFRGSGTPEASVTAPVGSLYLRTDGGAGTSFYVKESGAGNTGWVGK